MSRLRLGVLVSGGGRTFQNLVDRSRDGRLDADVAGLVANRTCGGVDRATATNTPALVTPDSEATFAFLREHRVDLVCMGGYLRLLQIPDDFTGRVINIHPSLLPRHGGQGYYGDRVHRAVLEAGDSESGCTVHHVTAVYDDGPILVQHRVPVLPDDTVDTLAARVFEAECEAYPDGIRAWRTAQQSSS